MKKPVSKAEERARLQREVERFLNRGGQVENVPTGVSGKNPGDPPVFLNRRLFVEPATPRTPIPEVIAAIESRRGVKPNSRPTRKKNRLPQPKRKTIYDDFGEPLRRVWIEE
ncbi:MAG: hypothetical protein AAGF57_07960 [Pseudomonadota bacterium]